MSGIFIVSNFAETDKLVFESFKDAYENWMNSPTAFFFSAENFLNHKKNIKNICDISTMENYIASNDLRNELNDLVSVSISDKEIDAYWDDMVTRSEGKITSMFDDKITISSIDPKAVDNNRKTTVALSKPRVSDVPPVALFALGGAMQDGAEKYGRFNWRDTSVTASVFYDAIHRHLSAWYNGEDFASDSKIHHLAHIMASCAILLDAPEHHVFNDDRDKRKPEPVNKFSWKQLKEDYA